MVGGVRRIVHVGVAALVVALMLPAIAVAQDAAPQWWKPAAGVSWQYQLSGKVDPSVKAKVYIVDGAETPKATVAALQGAGRKVVCYLSAGSWENWRDDAGAFPAAVKGSALDGWPGERWLDVRQLSVLEPLMAARMDECKAKGFDAVDPDNVDGYANDTGFPIQAADQLAYNRMLASLAHERGLAVGLKNDVGQVDQLVADFDFAVNEECVHYAECGKVRPFVDAGKPVFHVEYTTPKRACDAPDAAGFSTIVKKLALGAWRRTC